MNPRRIRLKQSPRSSDPTNEIQEKGKEAEEGREGGTGVGSSCTPLVNRKFQRDVPVASNEKHDETGYESAARSIKRHNTSTTLPTQRFRTACFSYPVPSRGGIGSRATSERRAYERANESTNQRIKEKEQARDPR